MQNQINEGKPSFEHNLKIKSEVMIEYRVSQQEVCAFDGLRKKV